ncbi:MAG: hemolysin family protein [Rhodomicrobium sp.]
MSTQQEFDTGKPKASPSWLQRMAANLGFASEPSLRETLESAIEETPAEDDDSLSLTERTMLLNVLGFGGRRVAEVMIPRADIVAIEDILPIAALFALFAKAGHSRVPVFHESLDNPVGMVHIKDAIAWATRNGVGKGVPRIAGTSAESIANLDFGSAKLNTPISETGLIREVLFVPPSMPALTLLAKMKAKKIHLALVVDEFGGTDGLVTFGDLVEAIVGDIEDEHDSSTAPTINQVNEAFVASARAPIEVVEQALGVLLAYEGAGDVDTLGGLIMAIAGSMPKRGQIVQHPAGVTFEILEAGPRRLHSVRISKQLALAAPDTPLLLPAPGGGQASKPDSRPHTDVHSAKAA